MKIYYPVVLCALPGVVAGYSVGGFDLWTGRPVVVSSPSARNAVMGGCGPTRNNCSPPNEVAARMKKRRQQQQAFVDRAFEELATELGSTDSASRQQQRKRRFVEASMRNPENRKTFFKNKRMMMDEDVLRKQQDWVNRAFGIASEVATDFATSNREVKETNEALRQQQEWVNRMFGVATDFAGGPRGGGQLRSEILQDDDQAFQMEVEVPGIAASNIVITVEQQQQTAGEYDPRFRRHPQGVKMLMIQGEREIGTPDEGVSSTKKFSKSVVLDSTLDTDKIVATLDNGVLTITIPKDVDQQKLEEMETRKIPVVSVSDDELTTTQEEEEDSDVSRKELDVPGVKASNIEVTVEGDDYDGSILKVSAKRELGGGKMEDGSPRVKEISRTFYLDPFTDTDNITATLNNGVLTVTAPKDRKKMEEKIKTIPIVPAADAADTTTTTKDAPVASVVDLKSEDDDASSGAEAVDIDLDDEDTKDADSAVDDSDEESEK